MNTFQLSCFVEVAEALNFARAAEQLHVTQPAVTHQIRSLETELGAELFRRTTRSVRLTSAGHLFLPDAKSLLALSIRAKRRFEHPYDREMLHLAIGCHSYSQLFPLAHVLKRLSGLYPNLAPWFHVVPFHQLYRLLAEGETDVIICFEEEDTKKAPGIYRELKQVPVVCVCSKGHHLAAREAVSLSDLEQEKLSLIAPQKSPVALARLQSALMGGRAPSDFYFCEAPESGLVLTKAGMAVSVLPESSVPPDGDLVCIPVEGMAPLSLGLYYKTLKHNSPLKDFVHFMKEEFM